MNRKPIKASNGVVVTGSNFETLYFTLKQAKQFAKDKKKRLERSFTNGFKFKHCDVIEKENYFTISMS